jgi:hypothetical protein
MIELKGSNLDISELFKNYLSRSNRIIYNNNRYGYDDWYDYDDDYYSDWYGSSSSSIDNNSISDDNDENDVRIYFYRDIKNMDSRLLFTNLNDFDEFLDDEGIYVTPYEIKKLMSREVSHCCIEEFTIGSVTESWLISDCSYSGLSWSVSGDSYYEEDYSKDCLPF